MARKYKRLCYEDRQIIEKMLKAGNSVGMIATTLGVHRDTIYKELVRSGTDQHTYSAEIGQKTI
jgi:IS30 family transposase